MDVNLVMAPLVWGLASIAVVGLGLTVIGRIVSAAIGGGGDDGGS
jgi:hypothetical protein